MNARLDVSLHDDTCRLRHPNAVWLQAMFTRWANSLFVHWKQAKPSRRHTTTADSLSLCPPITIAAASPPSSPSPALRE